MSSFKIWCLLKIVGMAATKGWKSKTFCKDSAGRTSSTTSPQHQFVTSRSQPDWNQVCNMISYKMDVLGRQSLSEDGQRLSNLWKSANAACMFWNALWMLKGVYKGFRATYTPLKTTSISGKALCISGGQCKPHTAAITTAWIRSRRVRVLNWPACRPDLSPIGNIWRILK